MIQSFLSSDLIDPSAVVLILGQEIVAGEDIYGGSDRLLSQVVPRTGVVVKLVWSPSLQYPYNQVISAICIYFSMLDELRHQILLR